MGAVNHDKHSIIENVKRLESEVDYTKKILIEGFPKGINFGDREKAEEEVIMRLYRNLQYLELSILNYLKERG